MPPYHLSSTSRALYRVFVAPDLNRLAIAPSKHAVLPASLTPAATSAPRPFSSTPHRPKRFTKDTSRHAITDHFVLDSAITSPLINFIDIEGKYYAGVSTREAFESFNHKLNHLVQVKEGSIDEFGDPDPNNPPTCRVIPRMQLRLQHEKLLNIQRKQDMGTAGGKVGAKELELNWAIAGGDLAHRLEKLREFLREGRKVEVVIGPKRRGKKATDEEARGIMSAIRSAVEDVKALEPKEPDGVVGGVMKLTFQGRETEEKKTESVEQEASAPELDLEAELEGIKSKRLRKQKEKELKAKAGLQTS